MNEARLVGRESGPSIVPSHDWRSFLTPMFTKVKLIKKFHHFTVDATGILLAKEFIDSAAAEAIFSLSKESRGLIYETVILRLSTELKTHIMT